MAIFYILYLFIIHIFQQLPTLNHLFYPKKLMPLVICRRMTKHHLHRWPTYLLLGCLALLFYACTPNISPSQHQITLGHYLFFDKRLSLNRSKSCASCHSPELAFTDGYRTSITPLVEMLRHNAPSLLNIQDHTYFDWANPRVRTLTQQMRRPLYGHMPVELGLDQHIQALQAQFQQDSFYAPIFKKAFPEASQWATQTQIEAALFAYEQQLQSRRSLYDLHQLDSIAVRGEKLFMSSELNCSECHRPPDFTLANQTDAIDSVFQNIGIYPVNNPNDSGIANTTHQEKDRGKYKIPSLRNVALTAPYMHDGSLQNLNQVIDLYARGGQLISQGPYAGDGATHPQKSNLIKGFSITATQRNELIHFLESLTDTSYLQNPLFTDPWPTQLPSSGY